MFLCSFLRRLTLATTSFSLAVAGICGCKNASPNAVPPSAATQPAMSEAESAMQPEVYALTSGPVLKRTATRTLHIDDFKGQTYLQMMQSPSSGIYDKTTSDYNVGVKIATASTIVKNIGKCDPSVGTKAYSYFTGGETDFKSIVGNISGQSLSSASIISTLTPFVINLKNTADKKYATERCATLALLASGSGTLVTITPKSYFYNVSYNTSSGANGRTFAVTSTRKLLDASDSHYLGEMDALLKSSSMADSNAFYDAFLRVLVQCDSSGFSALSTDADTVDTDLLAIYTAELIRHNSAGLNPTKDPWEIDLGEVTFLTAYGAASGMVMQNGSLVPGKATAYYGQGTSSGTGIGATEDQFEKLGRLITAYETASNPTIVNNVLTNCPITDPSILADINGDLFRQILIYMTQPGFQATIASKPDPLRNAVLALLAQIRTDQAAITTYVQTH